VRNSLRHFLAHLDQDSVVGKSAKAALATLEDWDGCRPQSGMAGRRASRHTGVVTADY
jgi:hypothetical protein